MLLFVLIAAILAAAFNAASTVFQRKATGSPNHSDLFSRKFALSVSLHPLFLVGLVFQMIAAALHLLALSKGTLLIVQPLLSLDLVFLFVYLHFKYKLTTGKKEWLSIAAIVIGIGTLFIIANPRSGTAPYELTKWLVAVAACIFIAAVSVFITKRNAKSRIRPAAAGMAAASGYALNASLAKLTLSMLKLHGLGYVFVHWPVYGLIISAIVSILLMQNAYGAGSLTISQPVMEIFDPLISSVIGLVNFGDIISHSPEAIFGELVSASVLAWGIYTLGGSKKMDVSFK